MTTVKINDPDGPQGQTPSQQATAQSQKTHVVSDARGRKLTLRKPGILSTYRLIELLGKSAENTTYVSMVLPLVYVIDIDGEEVEFPVFKAEVDALIKQLDDDGVEAVMEGVAKHWGKQEAGGKDALKK